ncbi:20147_t:CDS:1 [Funneliformis geosporum]|uniref:4227_t:CDS:1 n=1 Tax=Funneliformis geosporum TaxID=1117311 RepID=A0A9W4SNG0_9GLOM|nr:20147_t:CDS:1 [Funneliformis geosporum]CAI2174743.1 4227_t:CDS:1 [Funneliformis geosporum]
MTYNRLCFIYILIHLLIRIESFTPEVRHAHSSVLVGNKLYIFGGKNETAYTNEVFYLDVSQQFDTGLPPWTDLTLNSGIGFRSGWSTTVALNDDNDDPTIFLIGGFMFDKYSDKDAFTSLVHRFNPKFGQWDALIISGKEPDRRRDIQAVADDSGKI